MYTIWGETDSVYTICEGFHNVGTAGHGGFVLTKQFAEANLSKEALKIGQLELGRYHYEEDCDYAVVVYELIDKYDLINKAGFSHMERDSLLKCAFNTLSRWNPEYLLSKKVQPESQAYKKYKND